MRISLRDATTAELPCRTRLPFRFGAVTLTAAPLLHLRVEAEGPGGRTAVGMASDLLVPRWFRKDLDRPAAADQEALRASLRQAVELYRERGPATVFELWQHVHAERIEREPSSVPDLLERGFGVALVERALIDATCRLERVPFADAVGSGLLGRAFQGIVAARRSIAVRHTVGRLDPLRAQDVALADRVEDGMPQTLEEVLRVHAPRWLKVKIGGGVEDDAARLSAIGALLDDLGLSDIGITLDGNEQFESFAQLRELWRCTAGQAHGRSMLDRVRWVEQPLARARSTSGQRDWSSCPLLLDEADAQRRSWADSGYEGVSIKNCKGVFRALLASERAAEGPWFQSSEDLTNLPILALQQDLCTATALQCEHSERNGHHYFPGLDHLPERAAGAALDGHPDLYEATATGARLRVRAGRIETASLHGPGYGCADGVLEVLGRELAWQAVGA